MTLPNADDFREKLHQWFAEDAAKGKKHIVVSAGALHRAVGGYPARDGNHRMRTCCVVMNIERRPGDNVVDAPPSGFGANLVVRFRLPRPAST